MIHLFADDRGQPFAGSHEADLYIIIVEILDFVRQIVTQELHDEMDFRDGTFPVFRGERVGSDNLYSKTVGCPYDGFQCFRPGLVTKGADFPLGLGPAAVAIHNDGDVLRNIVRAQARRVKVDLLRHGPEHIRKKLIEHKESPIGREALKNKMGSPSKEEGRLEIRTGLSPG